jgi:hypothetical protein
MNDTIRPVVWRILLYLAVIGLAVSLLIPTADGAEFLVPRHLSFTEGQYHGNVNRDPYLGIDNAKEKFEYHTSLAWEFDLVCIEDSAICMYWNNEILAKTTTRQYRSVAWEFEVGFNLKRVEFFYNHMSRHCLECNADQSYPLENYVGFRLNIYENPRRN